MKKRTSDGQFVRVCANTLHIDIAAGIDIDIVQDGFDVSRLKAGVRKEWAKENKERARLLSGSSHRKLFLCLPCHNFFQARASGSEGLTLGRSDSTDTAARSTSSPSVAVKTAIEQLKTLETDELAQVARFLGESQQTAIKRDIKQLPVNNIDNLCDLDVQKWIDSRNPVICAFLRGISTDPVHTVDKSREVDLAKAIEHIYYLQNKLAILPISLSENLVSYAVSRSKLVCNTISSSSPAGSHTYVTNFHKNQAATPLPPPVGDILCAFDNDQVIGKTFHVRQDNKVKCSVITSVCYAEVQPEGNLQCDASLKPGNWSNDRKIAMEVEKILDKDSDFNKAVDATHYKELYGTVQERIDIVKGQQIMKEDTWHDHVDDEIAREKENREWKLCWACGASNLKNKRVCTSCSVNLNAPRAKPSEDEVPRPSKPRPKPKPTHTQLEFSYMFVEQENDAADKKERVQVKAGEPIFVNPNSHLSVISVLQDIGKQVNIKKYVEGGCREWVAVTCDGLPFTIAQRVLRETFRCKLCQSVLFTRKAYIAHCKEHKEYNEQEERIPFDLEFDWVVLKIGHGHFEMNMLKSFFKLNWDVFVKDLAKCMGFCSENAQKYAKSGADHHKSWELLQILYLGSIDELVLPYVRHCLDQKTEPTADGFFRWSRNVGNARYQYLQEQMLTYASAIIHLRRGIRRNDMALIIAGRVKYAPIFHSRNHPKYQQIELVELSNFLAAPPELQDFLARFQAISVSGDPERCEDMDFILEAINKKSKSWAPKGVPSHDEWERLFRNLQKFDELRNSVFSRMRREDPDASNSYSSSHVARDEEVTAWRTRLRGSHFLDDPLSADASFHAVGSEKLDPQLVNLTQQATERRKYFASKMFGGSAVDDATGEPDQVFVTEAERAQHNDVRNQRKDVIAARVLQAIGSLDDESMKTVLLAEWETSIKHKNRPDFISFFLRVEEEVAQQELVAGRGIDMEGDD